jgi:NADPH-dependent curcumin reductase CurA
VYGTARVEEINHQVRLAARPHGTPVDSDWEHTTEPVRQPADGEFLVRQRWISLDPAMRGWMDDRPSYVPPVGLGEVMRAGGVGDVIASRHPRFTEGSQVVGAFGVQEYAVSNGDGVQPIDPSLAPPTAYLGVLGITGLTAYFGLLDIGRPEPGQTVLVSAAAGAVGSVVGQIAKIKDCRAIGIAGGPEKCALLTDDLGFDSAIDYRAGDVLGELRRAAPDRVDVYFDNVGGEILDAALGRLARGARVVICGAISQYNQDRMTGPSNYMALLVRRARMEGFVVFDYAKRYPEAIREMAGWMAEGRLKHREEIATGGVAAFPETLNRLFRGENTGKLILEV